MTDSERAELKFKCVELVKASGFYQTFDEMLEKSKKLFEYIVGYT